MRHNVVVTNKEEGLQFKILLDRICIVVVVLVLSGAQLIPITELRAFLSVVMIVLGIMIFLEYRDSVDQLNEYYRADISAVRHRHRLPLPKWEKENVQVEYSKEVEEPEPETQDLHEPASQANPSESAPVQSDPVRSVNFPTEKFLVYMYRDGSDQTGKIIIGEDELEKNPDFPNAGAMLREMVASGWLVNRERRKSSGWLAGTLDECLQWHGYLS